MKQTRYPISWEWTQITSAFYEGSTSVKDLGLSFLEMPYDKVLW